MSSKPIRLLLQAFVLATLTGAVGFLADSPPLVVVGEGQTTLKLMARHSGKVIGECRVLSGDDLAAKAPNMRQATVCPREKSSMAIRLVVNGQTLVAEEIAPSGLHNDGVLAFYQSFNVPVGETDIEFSVRDLSGSEPASLSESVVLEAGRESIIVVQLNDQGIRIFQPAHKSLKEDPKA
jgi:hypothetical protein